MSELFHHISVLLEPTVEYLCPNIGTDTHERIFLDCTMGGGGHSRAILQAHPKYQVIAIDRDPNAIAHTQKALAQFQERFTIVNQTFASALPTFENEQFDGILMDLGVSSPQLDWADRGFSFQKEGPLDMRMNPNEGIPASEWLQKMTEEELATILFKYGEEPRSRRIAKAIIQEGPWQSTLALAECIRKASGYKNSKTHPATRSFQAIRIALNNELQELESALPIAMNKLKAGGRLAIISFHSLEDRIVKHFFKECTSENAPKDAYGHPLIPPIGKILIRKGISGDKHDKHNPRARSARLRILEKCESPNPSSKLSSLF